MKDSAEEIIPRDEVNNWFILKIKYYCNMHKSYALILGQCAEGSKKKLQVKQYWEKILKTNQLVYLNQ